MAIFKQGTVTTCTPACRSLEGSEVQHCANLLIRKLEKMGVPELQFHTASLPSKKEDGNNLDLNRVLSKRENPLNYLAAS